MPSNPTIKLPKYVGPVLNRMRRGAVLCRQTSLSEEAEKKGGGFTYFTFPDGRHVTPNTGKRLVQSGAVTPQGDGLLDDWSQTFTLNKDVDVSP